MMCIKEALKHTQIGMTKNMILLLNVENNGINRLIGLLRGFTNFVFRQKIEILLLFISFFFSKIINSPLNYRNFFMIHHVLNYMYLRLLFM